MTAAGTYLQAISDALRAEMRADERVFVMGEDVGEFGGAFKVTDGLLDEFAPTPLTARVAREGADLTVVAYGAMVHIALEATEDLDGASVEVLDLRSLVPLDLEAILASVRKTSKVVVLDEANETCAAGAQVAALVADHAFEDLDGPVRRVASPDVPIPFSPPLEQAVLPGVERVRNACRELLNH